MVNASCAVLSVLSLMKLSLDAARLRVQYRVVCGDGGSSELQSTIRIYGNTVKYVPIAIMLMLSMEMNGTETWMVHIYDTVLLADCLVHYYGFRHRLFRWRRSDMSVTQRVLLLMVLANPWYTPWELASLLCQRTIRHFLFPGFLRYVSPRHVIFYPYRQTGRLDL